MLKQSLIKWIRISSLLYFIITFTMNMVYWITEKKPTIIKFNHNLIIFLFSFLIVGIISILFYKKPSKNTKRSSLIIYKASIIYTLISFYLRIHAIIDEARETAINNSKMIIIVLGVSIAVSISLVFIKFKTFLFNSLYYFILLGLSFILIFIVQAKYTKSLALIAIAIYIGIFLFVDLFIYFIYVKRKALKENSKKTYTSLFK